MTLTDDNFEEPSGAKAVPWRWAVQSVEPDMPTTIRHQKTKVPVGPPIETLVGLGTDPSIVACMDQQGWYWNVGKKSLGTVAFVILACTLEAVNTRNHTGVERQDTARLLCSAAARRTGELVCDELRIQTTLSEQCIMGAGLDHPAFIERYYEISIAHGRESVSDDNCRSVGHQFLKGFPHRAFVDSIEM